MAKYVSASKAAALLGLNEKTVRSLIERGEIQAYHVSAKRFNVSMDEVHRIAAKRGIELEQDTEVSIASLDLELLKLRDRIEQLEQLRERLERLEQRLEHADKPIAPRAPAERPTTMKERKPHTSMTTEAKGTLPEGLVAFTDFYKAHSISETTARRGLEGQCFPVVSGPWHRGNSVIKQALDLSGQRAFCEYFSSKGKLHQCEVADCPCHTLAAQQ